MMFPYMSQVLALLTKDLCEQSSTVTYMEVLEEGEVDAQKKNCHQEQKNNIQNSSFFGSVQVSWKFVWFWSFKK